MTGTPLPSFGSPITMGEGMKLNVPDQPIIPFIEGDGTGRTSGARRCACSTRPWPRPTAASEDRVEGGARRARRPSRDRQLAARRDDRRLPKYLVGIKGPLTTPIGGGIRSLNVALRQILDLYVCLRPVRWFQGVPSPVKRPQLVDMVIFRENTEDIYAGIEFAEGTPDARRSSSAEDEFPKDYKKIRFQGTNIGHRRQAGVARGHGAPVRGRSSTRSTTSARA
jgi:isocitrate dehydrogenase